MDKKPALATPPGVKIREFVSGARLQIAFTWQARECRELLPPGPINKGSIQYAANLRAEIRRKVVDGTFDYAAYFPDSPRAKAGTPDSALMQTLLERQLETYARQVENGQMSPATYRGYEKSIQGERMRRWHAVKLRDVTPSALREWIGDMDCTSKAIRNMLIPLRSVFDDALNDDLIEFNPFDRIALAKLIRQTARASDYVIQPLTEDERERLLQACRPDERPMMQFWFTTGLRPGELQALQWDRCDFDRRTVRIELNQVAGVVKGPKTAAGIRDVDLSDDALRALAAQKPLSALKGARVWLNPRNGEPWETDAQIRKTLWQPLCTRAAIQYRNPYQVRHTYASSLLTAGANPWYVAAQLGHEDVEMVFRTYGKFIREDYQKPKAALRLAT
ncbi:integrase [Oryzisolibacter propanilivorax]|uniref:Integrase n=1 Tax=Oryzisolibacter propanilivorax TaxID=1527607 RepID=A0A1G9SKV1_9BURK|nr:site-specific integrase [Oryzisolibacter propanilivorax]SDM36108.1 integrase [Oryzisolibacter propanilivorax]